MKKQIKRITKTEAEKAITYETISKFGLPKGEVVKLLKKLKVDKALIAKVANDCVPYGHTPEPD